MPEEQHRQYTPPPKKYARTQGIHADFLRAIKEGGDPPSSNFPDVSGPYVEALLVGNLAMLAGLGKKVKWGWREHALHQLAGVESARPSRIPQRLVALAVDSHLSLPKIRVQIWIVHDEGHRLLLGTQLLGKRVSGRYFTQTDPKAPFREWPQKGTKIRKVDGRDRTPQPRHLFVFLPVLCGNSPSAHRSEFSV